MRISKRRAAQLRYRVMHLLAARDYLRLSSMMATTHLRALYLLHSQEAYVRAGFPLGYYRLVTMPVWYRRARQAREAGRPAPSRPTPRKDS